ncbi:MAG TPA: hypothetical protein VNB49_19150, partial [Candidatus Dormibacteraeota bacterium]|nr:hypothetical protein [Candidatus Dormibacteraeota bacterium]
DRSPRMAWYLGPTLLEHLETVPLPRTDSLLSFRFPVQSVIRPDARFRGFAGRVAGGTIRPGDSVLALPSGQQASVRTIVTFDGELSEASAPMSVTLELDKEIDLSRGDMLVSPGHRPNASRRFRATAVWLHATPLELDRTYIVKHTARVTKIRPLRILHRVDVNTLEHQKATRLEMNEIGSIDFESHLPLFFDSYSTNRTTGSFILINALTNATVGAGMIQEALSGGGNGIALERARPLPGTDQNPVPTEERYARQGHSPGIFLFEGESPLAIRLERLLFEQGFNVLHLRGSEFPNDSFPHFVRLAQKAGILLIYSADALTPQAKEAIATGCGDRLFDLAAARVDGEDSNVIQRALAIAESLRVTTPPEKQER